MRLRILFLIAVCVLVAAGVYFVRRGNAPVRARDSSDAVSAPETAAQGAVEGTSQRDRALQNPPVSSPPSDRDSSSLAAAAPRPAASAGTAATPSGPTQQRPSDVRMPPATMLPAPSTAPVTSQVP